MGGWRQQRLHPSPRPPSLWRGESHALAQILKNPQNPQKTAHLINPEIPHLLDPENPQHLLGPLDNTAISNPKEKLEQNQVIHETRLPEVVTPHKYTN